MKAVILAVAITGVTPHDVVFWDFDFISRDYGESLWTVYDYEDDAC